MAHWSHLILLVVSVSGNFTICTQPRHLSGADAYGLFTSESGKNAIMWRQQGTNKNLKRGRSWRNQTIVLNCLAIKRGEANLKCNRPCYNWFCGLVSCVAVRRCTLQTHGLFSKREYLQYNACHGVLHQLFSSLGKRHASKCMKPHRAADKLLDTACHAVSTPKNKTPRRNQEIAAWGYAAKEPMR